MPKPVEPSRAALLLCLLVPAGAVVALVLYYPLAAIVPVCVILFMLGARRTDLKGVLVFITMLSVQASLVYVVCWLLFCVLFPVSANLPLLASTLLVIKEWQRFTDNEFGEGLVGRRVLIGVIAIVAAGIHLWIVW